jgi:hypothetical protein
MYVTKFNKTLIFTTFELTLIPRKSYNNNDNLK